MATEAQGGTITVTDNRTGQTYEFPITDGTIRATDLRNIKVSDDDFGLMTYDPAFMNTASCRSAITYLDGDNGVLRYRGYPIEQLAGKSTFLEVAWLLIHGELPSAAELEALSAQWKIAEAEQQAHHAAVAELRMREQAVVERTRDVERLTQELATATSAVTESATLREALLPLAALQTEREALDQLASAEGRRAALVDSERAVTEEIARKEERRVIIAEAPQIEETLTTEVETQRQALAALEAALESAHTDWVRDRQEAETKRDALREQYTELRDQRERIIVAGEAGLCPTCQRPIGVNYRALLDTLDTQLDVVKVDGSYWRSRVEQLADRPATVTAMDEQRRMLQAAVTQLERKLERARVAAGELADLAKDRIRLETRLAGVRADLATLPTGYDAARHAVVRRELEQLLPLEKRLTRLAATAEEEPVLRARLAAVTAAQQALTAEIAAQRRAVDTTAAHAPQWESLRAVVDAAGAEAGLAAVAEAKATARPKAEAAAVATAEAAAAQEEEQAAAADEPAFTPFMPQLRKPHIDVN